MKTHRSRRTRHSLIEHLEPRTLLSAAVPGTPTSSFLQTVGTAHLTSYNAPLDLDANFDINFLRAVGTNLANGSQTTVSIQVHLFQHSTHMLLANLSSYPPFVLGIDLPPGSSNVHTSATGTSSHVDGTFTLYDASQVFLPQPGIIIAPPPPPVPMGTTNIDFTWNLTDLLTRQESTSLTIAPGSRTLENSTTRHAPAALTGSAAWATVLPLLAADVPGLAAGMPLVSTAPGATGIFDSTVTQDFTLPNSANLESLMQPLLPPTAAPTGSLLSFVNQQYASANFILPAGGVPGTVFIYGQNQFPDNSGDMTQGQINLPSGGFDTFNSGISFNRAGHTASVIASGQASNLQAYSMNLQFAATGPATSAFIQKTTAYNASTTATTYSSTLNFDTTVSGTLTVGEQTDAPTFLNGSLTEFSQVTITTPVGKTPPANFVPTVISQKDWDARVTKPAQAAIKLIHSLLIPQKGAPVAPVSVSSSVYAPATQKQALQLLS